MMGVAMKILRRATCMLCGGSGECAEILVTLDVMPGLTIRIVVCQGCWARTFRRFRKKDK